MSAGLYVGLPEEPCRELGVAHAEVPGMSNGATQEPLDPARQWRESGCR